MRVWIAQYESTHFTFTAIGETAGEALATLRKGLRKHGRQYNTATRDWFGDDLHSDAHVFEVVTGQTVRDYDHVI